MSGLVADAVTASNDAEGRYPGILDVSVVEGYPYADVTHMGNDMMLYDAVHNMAGICIRHH